MSRKLIAINGLWLVVALCVMQSATAQTPPPFGRDGEIHRINAHRQTVVINDVRYILPTSVQVYLYDGRARSSDDEYKGRKLGNGSVLRKGMHIGFNVEGEGPQRIGRVVEAWILLPNSLKASTE